MSDPVEPVVEPVAQPATPAVQQPATPSQSPPAQQKGTAIQDVTVLQTLITEVRAEAAEHRTKARAAEQAAETAKRELAVERLEHQLERAASKAGANPDLLVPWLRGSGQLEKLDTTDPKTLPGEIDRLVEAALTALPTLRATPPIPTSGPAPQGGGAVRNFTRREIQAMTAAEMAANLEAIEDWQRRGSPGID
jgi:hypothetical protein